MVRTAIRFDALMHVLCFMYVCVFGFDGKWQIGDYDGIIFYTFVNRKKKSYTPRSIH